MFGLFECLNVTLRPPPLDSDIVWTGDTLFHTESLIGLVGPHQVLFLIVNKSPLERSVLKEIV